MANKIENDVSKISCGVSLETCRKTWGSVITREGFLLRLDNVSFNVVSLFTTATAPLSKISLIACCWGNMSMTLGAVLY